MIKVSKHTAAQHVEQAELAMQQQDVDTARDCLQEAAGLAPQVPPLPMVHHADCHAWTTALYAGALLECAIAWIWKGVAFTSVCHLEIFCTPGCAYDQGICFVKSEIPVRKAQKCSIYHLPV